MTEAHRFGPTNANWVCFECRRIVRRMAAIRVQVTCPGCGQLCHNAGTKIRWPLQRRVKAWRRLQTSIQDASLVALARAERLRVAYLHRLEQNLATLVQRPFNEDRHQQINHSRQILREAMSRDARAFVNWNAAFLPNRTQP